MAKRGGRRVTTPGKTRRVRENSEPSAVTRRRIDLYDAWDTAEPGKGHDTQAAKWRAKLPKVESEEGK